MIQGVGLPSIAGSIALLPVFFYNRQWNYLRLHNLNKFKNDQFISGQIASIAQDRMVLPRPGCH